MLRWVSVWVSAPARVVRQQQVVGQRATLGAATAQVGVGGGAARLVLPMEVGQGRVGGQAPVVAVEVVQVPAATTATQLASPATAPWAQTTATAAPWHRGPTAGSGTRCGRG